MNLPFLRQSTYYVFYKVSEQVPPPENTSDSSTHSRVFSTGVPPTTPATPKRKKKIVAKKTPTKITVSTAGDLTEVFKLVGPKDPNMASSTQQIPEVFVTSEFLFSVCRIFSNTFFYRTRRLPRLKLPLKVP